MCITPITIRKNTPDQMMVGCGRCIPCHLNYCNQWQLRFTIHANHNPTFHCVTLTYDTMHTPYITASNDKKYMTLVKAHASNFFKTLRNNHVKRYGKNALKISYMIAGEYGDKFKKPHYHAIIFNAHIDDITTSWKHGHLYFGTSDLKATCNYALKYTLKSRTWKNQKNYSYERPFVNFSKGIGEDLIARYITRSKVVDGKTITYQEKTYIKELPEVIKLENTSVLIPRYYADKIGQKIDSEKWRLLAIEKYRKVNDYIENQNLTRAEWSKMYHYWKSHLDKNQLYDNAIFTDAPLELLAQFNNVVKNKSYTKKETIQQTFLDLETGEVSKIDVKKRQNNFKNKSPLILPEWVYKSNNNN